MILNFQGAFRFFNEKDALMGPQASLTKNVHFPKKSAFCNIGYNIDIDIGYNKDVGYIIYNPGPRTPQMGLLYKKQNIQRAAKLRSGHRA